MAIDTSPNACRAVPCRYCCVLQWRCTAVPCRCDTLGCACPLLRLVHCHCSSAWVCESDPTSRFSSATLHTAVRQRNETQLANRSIDRSIDRNPSQTASSMVHCALRTEAGGRRGSLNSLAAQPPQCEPAEDNVPFRSQHQYASMGTAVYLRKHSAAQVPMDVSKAKALLAKARASTASRTGETTTVKLCTQPCATRHTHGLAKGRGWGTIGAPVL